MIKIPHRDGDADGNGLFLFVVAAFFLGARADTGA